jgi:FMN phosphatase YigB (HAD superfamily)
VRVEDFYPDAVPCLKALAEQGFVLGLAGNQPVRTEAALHHLGLPVAFVASSEGWGVEKPSPAFFDRIRRESRLGAGEIAYVGDRLDNDILPARRAGMFTVFLRRGPWGHLHAHWPEAAVANLMIESLSALPQLLEWARHPDE